ncbi:ATPase, T2SS/T4P/T4SS family [Bacillus sp. RO1]|uniref:ATPase, T2SS/T4P/T4SS family n=1 Tax=Bacillus sp. RO1 TaxID=2722703 RepID=UPI0014563F15|nr:ATPase, T2SS/T4P/T4SS family [Bacillus sp. RO1]NLP52200.1 Flp pilus assembly complex ATPase component TadA [Bacillus sp. RO1]
MSNENIQVLEKTEDRSNRNLPLHLDDLSNDSPFDVASFVSKHTQIEKDEQVSGFNYQKKKDFKQICDIIKSELDSNNVNEGEYLERQHKAIIGDEAAIGYFIAEIERVLRDKNITSTDHPSYFETLSQAVFHEVWGLSVLAKWDIYPESEACCVRGTQLWIDINGQFVRQAEEFESIHRVERIKRAFLIRSAETVLNRENPEVELEKEDGSRITMIQPPRSKDNYIMLRRFTVNQFTLEDQASFDTIPFKDVPLYRALSRAMPNTIVAGRVRSAKSTFMKTLIGERNPQYVGACLEKHFELALSKHFKDRLFFEIQAKEGDLHNAIPRLLRMEHDYIVIGEIRSLEIEAFNISTERGERGALSTYHLTDVQDIVEQLARHTLDEFPTRRFEVEVQRIAKNLDIIISMAADRDRKRKRVIGVTEVVFDTKTGEHTTVDLIRYSRLSRKYYYSSNISKRLLRLMAEENMEETKILYSLLKQREEESPMKSYHEEELSIDDLLDGSVGING